MRKIHVIKDRTMTRTYLFTRELVPGGSMVCWTRRVVFDSQKTTVLLSICIPSLSTCVVDVLRQHPIPNLDRFN